jgi:hypothetical protein
MTGRLNETDEFAENKVQRKGINRGLTPEQRHACVAAPSQ